MERGIRILKFKKVWLVESVILGFWNPEYSTGNPESKFPDKQFGIQSAWNPDCHGFLYMGRTVRDLYVS